MQWLPIFMVALISACASEPDPGEAGGRLPGDLDSYADAVMAFTEGADVRTCAATLASCEQVQLDACGLDEVLGAPDGSTFALGAGAEIEVAWRCGAVIELGELSSNDLTIWGAVSGGSSAVVEVSLDGTNYTTLDLLTQSDQSFDLSRTGLDVVRFVRISDRGAGGIDIDALEALAL